MLKELAQEYWSIHPFELAAALSYYTLLSLAPLLLMSVAVAGVVFDRAVVESRIVNEMRLLVGPEGSDVVETVLRHTRDPHKGRLSVIVGISVLFLGATSVFVQLQSALNRIWKVEESPHANVLWVFVKDRLLSLAMVLGVGFLLLVSLLVSAAIAAVGASRRGGIRVARCRSMNPVSTAAANSGCAATRARKSRLVTTPSAAVSARARPSRRTADARSSP